MSKTKSKKTSKVLRTLGVTTLVLALGAGSAFAMTVYLNWTGTDIVVRTKEFISSATSKIISQDRLITKLKNEKKELETQLEEALRNNESINNENSQTIIELQNQIIEKDNEINHLIRELERANSEVAEQGAILDEALQTLSDANINLYWTEE